MNPVRSRLLGLFLLLSFLAPLEKAMADQERGEHSRRPAAAGAVTLPLAGTVSAANQVVGQFSGTVTINRFAKQDNQIVAVAVVRGTVTNLAGQVLKTGLQTVVLPVTGINSQTAVAFATPYSEARIVRASFTNAQSGRFMLAQAQTCGILHLDIGGNAVNLLGFIVNLSPITLDISGDSAGPLGALVCQVLGLLGTAADVVGLLNQVLGLVTGLLGGLLGGLGG